MSNSSTGADTSQDAPEELGRLFSLAGKVALITGASRGIGEAIARAYAAAGARVVLASRKQEGLEAVAAEITAGGGQALAAAAHTGDDAAVQRLIERVVGAYGGVDILVNNAATNPHFGPILSAEDSHWDKTFDVNVKGYFRLAKACVPWMRARGGGKIINMASIAGTTPQPGMGIYCVSKAAVLMLTEVLAVELAADNIQVNAIAPGFIKTRFSAAIWDNPALNRATLAGIPQGRMAAAHELVGIALYLAAPASSFTTGATFLVDGGQAVGDPLYQLLQAAPGA
jgi:NAD(P)-dependent dehydrogenase (short-subunit alcohol dehydrogenase family)